MLAIVEFLKSSLKLELCVPENEVFRKSQIGVKFDHQAFVPKIGVRSKPGLFTYISRNLSFECDFTVEPRFKRLVLHQGS